MFVEIVDALRCPRSHEESWLVLAARRTEDRHVLEGTLGCPVCRAEYPIHDGIADFSDPTARDHAPVSIAGPLPPADHLAAMLNLGDALGFAVLIGAWGVRADALRDLLDAPPLLLVDPPHGVAMGRGLSGIRAGTVLPLATGAAPPPTPPSLRAWPARRARHASADDWSHRQSRACPRECASSRATRPCGSASGSPSRAHR